MSVLFASTATDTLSMFEPASSSAASIRELFFLVLAITGAIFFLVQGVLLYCIWRFRRRPDTSPAEPPQIYGSGPIEVAWTVAPLLVVFVLFLVMVRTVAAVRPSKPAPGIYVTVIGHQWWWEYEVYETTPAGEKGRLLFRTANELHVPHSQSVLLDLQSADVIHSWWVPRLAGKVDVIPGKVNRLWFQPLETGVYHGQCAEYCGTQHANMLLRVIVVPPTEYASWVREQARPAANAPEVQAGSKLFHSLSCVKCHVVQGTGADGRFGPDLTHLMSRHTLAAMTVPNSRDNLLRWVKNPDDLKPGARMPSFQLTEQQLQELVAYLETLR